MSETQQAAPEGVVRTADGTIQDQSKTTTDSTQTTTSTDPAPDLTKGKSLLTAEDKVALTGAPEKYETFTAPEGFTLDEKVATEASALFKGMNLSQAQGQQLVDFYASKAAEAAQAPYDAYLSMREGWVSEVKADAEIGSKLPQVKTTIAKAIDSLGDPALATAFREAMDFTGAGDHPAFIKAFYKLAQRVTEGGHVQGKGPSAFGQAAPGAARSAAHAVYPNLP